MVEIRKVDVPIGTSGAWAISRFEVSEQAAKLENLRAAIGGSARPISPGTYTRLSRDGQTVMSDTTAELEDLEVIVREASGRVLIAGLGLGVVLQALLDKPEVESVTVVEQSQCVIALVAQHYQMRYGWQFSIVCDDILQWRPGPGESWDWAWFDIWDNICTDNIKEMTFLKRRFARRAKNMRFWCYREHQYAKRRWPD